MRLLDSDVAIDVFRGHAPAIAWLTALPDPPGLPGPVVMELVEGCRNRREVQALMRRLTPFQVYWLSDADQMRALATFARAHLPHGLGLLDALIGEAAVGLSATLCTFNVRHFRAIPGLTTEQPYTRWRGLSHTLSEDRRRGEQGDGPSGQRAHPAGEIKAAGDRV